MCGFVCGALFVLSEIFDDNDDDELTSVMAVKFWTHVVVQLN